MRKHTDIDPDKITQGMGLHTNCLKEHLVMIFDFYVISYFQRLSITLKRKSMEMVLDLQCLA